MKEYILYHSAPKHLKFIKMKYESYNKFINTYDFRVSAEGILVLYFKRKWQALSKDWKGV